jgi:hypothetical protein
MYIRAPIENCPNSKRLVADVFMDSWFRRIVTEYRPHPQRWEAMPALFNYQRQLEHGTKNAMVARLTVQVANLLQYCGVDQEVSQEIMALYQGSMIKRLLRCWEIEQRIRGDIEKAKASFKPATGGAAQEIPSVPRLKEDCENFLREFRSFLLDLLGVFNRLYGTDYSEASEWTTKSAKHATPVMDYVAEKFGANDLKSRFLKQMKECNQPFIWMRNAADHPGERSGTLHIQDFSIDAHGNLVEPTWSREDKGKAEYGPKPILSDLTRAVHNLFVSGEDVLAMWAMDNLMLRGVVILGVVPEADRVPGCPVKYKLTEGPLSPARAG